jgi:ATP-binding cassette, subfamily B, bacterial
MADQPHQASLRQRARTFYKRQRYRLHTIQKTLGLIAQSRPRQIIMRLVLYVISGLIPVLFVQLTKNVIERFVRLPEATDTDFILMTVLLTGALFALQIGRQIISALALWLDRSVTAHMGDHVNDMILDKITQLDLAQMDTSEYFEQIQKATMEARDRPTNLLHDIGSLLQSITTLVGFLLILLQYSLWLPVLLIGVTLPSFWLEYRHNLHKSQWAVDRVTAQRRSGYFNSMLTGTANAVEIRLFDAYDYFRTRFMDVRDDVRGQLLDIEARGSVLQVVVYLIKNIGIGVILVWSFFGLLRQSLSLGDVFVFYQTLTSGQNAIKSIMKTLGNTYEHSIFMDNFFQFLDLQPSIVQDDSLPLAPTTITNGITFENVSFTYPAGYKSVLRDLNLFVPAGKIVGIVGPNGAGKSTLIKLLCRMYDPDAGDIRLDEQSIQNMQLHSLRARITALFQVPLRYQASVSENIRISALKSDPKLDDIRAVAQLVDVDDEIQAMKDGYETILGKMFGETNISMGQWRRIALARAMLRDAPIVILDEPTSSLDPWAERQWLERFPQMMQDKTVILITHRFTTTTICDYIYVLREGAIAEGGTHEELLAQDGYYAQSWRSQQSRYQSYLGQDEGEQTPETSA